MASEISLQGYEILEKLGEGGMAEVFLARQVSLDRKVVIKKLLASRQDAERIRKEGLILSRLNHPNIVTVYDLIEENGGFYLVEEYLEGVTLRQYLEDCIKENEPIPFDSFSKLAGQIIEGVECAHAKGVIHRDLKPENIVILEDGRVKICDFGISAFDTQAVSSTYKIAGTLEYMPPELFDDNPQITVLGDYYSLGCIFYEMITLKRPFGFTDKTGLMTVIKRKTTTIPDFGSEDRNDFNKSIASIKRMVSLNCNERMGVLEMLKTGLSYASSLNGTSILKTKTILSKDLKRFISNKPTENPPSIIQPVEENIAIKDNSINGLRNIFLRFFARILIFLTMLFFFIGLFFLLGTISPKTVFGLLIFAIFPREFVANSWGLFLIFGGCFLLIILLLQAKYTKKPFKEVFKKFINNERVNGPEEMHNFTWSRSLPSYMIPSTNAIIELEKIRKNFEIDEYSFVLRIASSIETTKKVQYLIYNNFQKQFPNESEKSILKMVLSSRFQTPPGYPPGHLLDDHEIEIAMSEINTIDELCEYITILENKELATGNDKYGIGAIIDSILRKDNTDIVHDSVELNITDLDNSDAE